MQPTDEPRTCTRINRPATECTAHNLHCGAPDCFAPQTTAPTLQEQLQSLRDMITPYLPEGVEAFVGDDGDLEGGPVPVLFLGKHTMTQTGEDSWEPDSEVWEPEEDELYGIIERMSAALAAAQAERDALRAALTPSTETKGAYMGEFQFDTEVTNPSWDEDCDEEDGEPEYLIERTVVPWDTIKQIMAAISARAALGGQS